MYPDDFYGGYIGFGFVAFLLGKYDFGLTAPE